MVRRTLWYLPFLPWDFDSLPPHQMRGGQESYSFKKKLIVFQKRRFPSHHHHPAPQFLSCRNKEVCPMLLPEKLLAEFGGLGVWKHIRTQDSSSVEDEGRNIFGMILNIKWHERTILGANCASIVWKSRVSQQSNQGSLRQLSSRCHERTSLPRCGEHRDAPAGAGAGGDGEGSNWRLLHSTRDLLCNVGDLVERVSAIVNLMEKLAFQCLP